MKRFLFLMTLAAGSAMLFAADAPQASMGKVLGEKNPSDMGKDENGPAFIADKAAAVKYLKDAFAYAHQAASAISSANAMDLLQSPFGNAKTSRINLVTELMWHSFDHYGQAVVYARMNGIVPPASRGQ